MITEKEMIIKFENSLKKMEDARKNYMSMEDNLINQESLCRDAKSKFYEAQLEHENVTRELEKYILDNLSKSDNIEI